MSSVAILQKKYRGPRETGQYHESSKKATEERLKPRSSSKSGALCTILLQSTQLLKSDV